MGVGRMATITRFTNLRRHRITWTVLAGGPSGCSLHGPRPHPLGGAWARLSGAKSIAHTKPCRSLPAITIPYSVFAVNPMIMHATESHRRRYRYVLTQLEGLFIRAVDQRQQGNVHHDILSTPSLRAAYVCCLSLRSISCTAFTA